MESYRVFQQSDGEVTKQYYAKLLACGNLGTVAVNLFRALKCSTRAKVYHGGIRGRGSFRAMAYERKAWSMETLCKALVEIGPELGIPFGWKEDKGTPLQGAASSWVLYIDIPQGQVSFHSPVRYTGPDYTGEWDGVRVSCERILAFCDSVIEKSPVASL